MNIVASNDISLLLEDLVKTMHGPNYQVYLEIKKFSFEGDAYLFTIDHLRKIYKENLENSCKVISGSFKLVPPKLAVEDINNCLKCTGYGDSNGYRDLSNHHTIWSINSIIEQQRLAAFWEVLNQHINFPPKYIFKFMPNKNDEFSNNWEQWGFCYVFLDDVKNRGLALTGEAYD